MKGWIEMFDQIGVKIKRIAYVILVLVVIIGTFWFVNSYMDYLKYKDYYDNIENLLTRALAVSSTSGMIGSVIFSFCGIVVSYLIYGFGVLVDKSENLDNKMNDFLIEYKEKHNVEGAHSDKAKNSYWKCSCGELISNEYGFCPLCGKADKS